MIETSTSKEYGRRWLILLRTDNSTQGRWSLASAETCKKCIFIRKIVTVGLHGLNGAPNAV